MSDSKKIDSEVVKDTAAQIENYLNSTVMHIGRQLDMIDGYLKAYPQGNTKKMMEDIAVIRKMHTVGFKREV